MSKSASIRNIASSHAARAFFVLASFSVLGLPTLAASAGSSAAQNAPTQHVQAQRNGGSALTQRSQAGQGQRSQGQRGQDQRGSAGMTANLEVSYFSGDPLKGGKLTSTVKLTPSDRQNSPQGAPAQKGQANQTANALAGQRVNPIMAQAPEGATFAVIQDPRGDARVIDLPQADSNGGAVGRGGRGFGGPAGAGGPPNGQQTPLSR